MRKVLLIILLCFPVVAFACRVAEIPASERIKQADHVYFGYVTGISLDSFLVAKRKDDLFEVKDIVLGSDVKTYRILVKENFKSKVGKVENVKIKWCGGGQAELEERVVVYTSKQGNYIEPLSQELYNTIKSGAL